MKNIVLRFSLLTIVAAMFAFGQPCPNCGKHADLKLTDAQQEQFEKLSFDMKKKQIELKAKLETSRLELHRLFAAETLDKSAVEKKMTEVSQQHVALRMNHINCWAEKNKLLNADQQKIWKKNLQRHPGAMDHNRAGQMMRHRNMMMDDDMPERMERRIEKKIIKE
ncbi:MAG: periplasmic heavy metal sensor [Bacteroidetes bacterium]|nr:periplasmic heavy metal sensor [Bacteroidota bacterium]